MEDAIKANLQRAWINTFATQCADTIGDAKLDTSKAIAHALLGLERPRQAAAAAAHLVPRGQ